MTIDLGCKHVFGKQGGSHASPKQLVKTTPNVFNLTVANATSRILSQCKPKCLHLFTSSPIWQVTNPGASPFYPGPAHSRRLPLAHEPRRWARRAGSLLARRRNEDANGRATWAASMISSPLRPELELMTALSQAINSNQCGKKLPECFSTTVVNITLGSCSSQRSRGE